MLDVHSLSAVADLLVYTINEFSGQINCCCGCGLIISQFDLASCQYCLDVCLFSEVYSLLSLLVCALESSEVKKEQITEGRNRKDIMKQYKK